MTNAKADKGGGKSGSSNPASTGGTDLALFRDAYRDFVTSLDACSAAARRQIAEAEQAAAKAQRAVQREYRALAADAYDKQADEAGSGYGEAGDGMSREDLGESLRDAAERTSSRSQEAYEAYAEAVESARQKAIEEIWSAYRAGLKAYQAAWSKLDPNSLDVAGATAIGESLTGLGARTRLALQAWE